MATKHGIRLSVLGALGVAVSSYGVYVKRQKLAWKDEYSALCDVERFSCSQVLTSENARWLLDVSNAHLGVLAYSVFMLYPVVRMAPYHAEFYCVVSCCATAVMLYLAYILAFVLQDFCLVYIATYVVTGGLLWNSLALVRARRDGLRTVKANKSE
ncbi:oxidoreductase activity protein [Phytophthora ramorum]|nr:Vitamin K epoxide reductase complex subunit 1 [Phytophthora ramorum]